MADYDRDRRDGRDFGPRDSNRKPFGERRSGDRNDRPGFNRDRGDRPFNNDRGERRPFGDRPARGEGFRGGDRNDRPRFDREDRPRFDRNDGERRPFNRDRNDGDRPRFNREDRPRFNRDDRPARGEGFRGGDHNDRPRFNREDRPRFDRNDGERRPFNRDRNDSDRPRFNREDRPRFDREDRPRFDRNDGERRPFNRDRNDGDRPRFNRDDRPARGEGFRGGDRNDRPRFNREDRPRFDRNDGERRPFNRDRNDGDRPRFNRDGGDRRRDGFRNDRRDAPSNGPEERRDSHGRVINSRDLRASNRPDRERSPDIDEDVTGRELDGATRGALRTLEARNSVFVAQHLVMAGRYLEDDPQLAYEHAQAASRRAGRLAVVREAVALTAYAAGKFAEALGEFRTFRRISGSNLHLPLMADCERGLGRPDKALELAHSEDSSDLDAPVKVELAIVASGAQADQGKFAEAVAELEIPQLDINRGFSYSPRLFTAYGEALIAADRADEAERWLAQAGVAEKALGIGDFAEPDIIDLAGDDDEDFGSEDRNEEHDGDSRASDSDVTEGGPTAESGAGSNEEGVLEADDLAEAVTEDNLNEIAPEDSVDVSVEDEVAELLADIDGPSEDEAK